MLGTKEHYDVMAVFERTVGKGMRLDHEAEEWVKRMGRIYQSGETNDAFQFYLAGYSLGKMMAQETTHD